MSVRDSRRTLLAIGAILIATALLWRAHWDLQRALRLRAMQEQAQLAAPDVWRHATPRERRDSMASITAQLNAFRSDDYRRAVTFQSAVLRAHFLTIAAFRQMMRTEYPQFSAYRSVRFGPARSAPDGRRVQIAAAVTGRDGVEVRAMYDMVLEAGAYRVAGVMGGFSPGVLLRGRAARA